MADMELQNLSRLEERILATVEQLRAARRDKTQAEQEAARLRERLSQSEQQLEALRAERRQISERLERLLSQIDSLGQE